MTQNLSTTIKGVTIGETALVTALSGLPQTFSKSDFAQGLDQAGIPATGDGDLVRRIMQYLKRQGMIAFDDATGTWSVTVLGAMRAPGKTLPLAGTSAPSVIVSDAAARSLNRQPDQIDPRMETLRLWLSVLACLTLVAALVGLNASFAWELGQERPQFQILITAGLMALDVTRPLFMMMGLYKLSKARWGAGVTALCVAFSLSPVSVLSTTSILAAAFQLGTEFNQHAVVQEESRQALQGEHARLVARADQAQAAWENECARGGCGPLARQLEADFRAIVGEAQTVLDQILELNEAAQNQSELLARLVSTFEELGIFGQERLMWLPLFLAISLEIGALFAPALLLQRRS